MEQLVARRAHNPKVTGSSPVPATIYLLNSTLDHLILIMRHFFLFFIIMLSGCTKHIGIINNISNEYDLNSEKFELAVENVSFTSSSLDSCIHLALISVPNSRYLKNTEIITKGKKVTIRTDIWKSIKTTEGNKKQLKKRSYSNLKSKKLPRDNNNLKSPQLDKFRVGMKVSWDHSKLGSGNGKIIKIDTKIALVETIDSQSNSIEMSLPLSILKRIK